MDFLTQLLENLAAAQTAEARAEVIAQALAADGVDLAALRTAITARFEDLNGSETALTDEQLTEIETLADVADGITAVAQAVAADAERDARRAEAAERIGRIPAPSAPAEAEDGPQTPADSGSAEKGTAGEAAPVAEQQAVAASARPKVPLGGGGGVKTAAVPSTFSSGSAATYTLVAAGDVPGYGTGQPIEGLQDLARAIEARMQGLSRTGSSGRGGIATLRRERGEAFTINHDTEWQKIDDACNEKSLPGGSLVAAGGWCAPSETLYDLCNMDISGDGMVKLPSVTAKRGGVRYPSEPDFSSVWKAVGFAQTEAEAIAGKDKTCYDIPCPDDFNECRMDIAGVCLRTPILSQKGWPERIAKFTSEALAVHAHKMNAAKIAKMASLSTKITFPGPVAGAETGDPVVDAHGPGAFESLLSILELQATNARYAGRLSQSTSLEMVAPYWLRGILRADLSKKAGIDNRYTVSDAQLDAYLKSRGVNPQWVYDWQDAGAADFGTGSDKLFGGGVLTSWPASVDIILYKAGAFFELSADVITLDGVYDHASLIKNMYTSLFTEEGWQVCKRCGDSYVLTIPLCPNGLSGALQATACAAA